MIGEVLVFNLAFFLIIQEGKAVFPERDKKKVCIWVSSVRRRKKDTIEGDFMSTIWVPVDQNV